MSEYPESPHHTEEVTLEGPRVLVVTPNARDGQTISAGMSGALRYIVVVVDSFAALSSTHGDLLWAAVVVDLQLPGCSGVDAVSRAVDLLPQGTPILATTDRDVGDWARAAGRAGASALLSRDGDGYPADLIAAIEVAVGQAEYRRSTGADALSRSLEFAADTARAVGSLDHQLAILAASLKPSPASDVEAVDPSPSVIARIAAEPGKWTAAIGAVLAGIGMGIAGLLRTLGVLP